MLCIFFDILVSKCYLFVYYFILFFFKFFFSLNSKKKVLVLFFLELKLFSSFFQDFYVENLHENPWKTMLF